ncbi:predicted protein [Plenodomus lingam JN3]|uniref:Predicted protein n=1 Tax=Leptosphaeria maculans (strain JN3 / isolate v23.1.3 / race Av1-4-5-6-7-8) TaxID=985895 RepID=E5A264_LEPMJ|nr:predicted protein [Plenodomus lingam JN3]CBX97941.1 predicted protein [Plenodomus lingam JN3]
MAPTEPPPSKKSKSTPKTVSGFVILPLTLPAIPGLPPSACDAKHYLYIKQHAPSVPTADDERSLFIANVPIDASETNLRALFAEQLGGAMVERVEFDGLVPAPALHKKWKGEGNRKGNAGASGDEEGRGRKRKREQEQELLAEGVMEDEESALPKLWSTEIKRSGSGAVVVFVDKKSCRGALKRIKETIKSAQQIHWKTSERLGIHRKSTQRHSPKPN